MPITTPSGPTVNLFFKAAFNNTLLNIPSGESLRTEVIVTFGNSGTRGGGGASASSIDINGNGTVDADEANVRSVPTRVTRNLPVLDQCNDTVQLSDTLSTTGASYSNVNDPSGLLTGVGISSTGSYQLSATVSGTGTVTNTVTLKGTDTFVTVQVPTGQVDELGNPIFAPVQIPCCVAADLTASSSVDVTEPTGFNDGDYCTYTQGGWGATPNGNNPASLLANNFGAVYSGGVEVGIIGAGGFSMKFTSASAVAAYLPAGGPGGPSILTSDLVNPTSTSSRVFGGQVLALQINVDFSDAGVTNNATGKFGDLKFANLVAGSQLKKGVEVLLTLTATQAAALNGKTVRQILADANMALGGGGLPSYAGSISELNAIADFLNNSFDNCVVTAGATDYLVR